MGTRIIILLCAAALALCAQGQKKELPQPRVVTPGQGGSAPSDAIALFNGKELNGWTKPDGSPTGCQVRGGEMVCKTGSGDAVSKETFGDAQVHVEFNVPSMPDQKGQMRGNSGVYIQSCYEVQILDSVNNPTYADGSLGAVYGFSAPMVNAARPPGEWQAYDIVFHTPRCDASGAVSEPGRMTVLLNGILVQENVAIAKAGPGCAGRNICEEGPLRLQDHSGFPGAPITEMRFRNVWLRKLDERR